MSDKILYNEIKKEEMLPENQQKAGILTEFSFNIDEKGNTLPTSVLKSIPSIKMSTIFESSGRFLSTLTGSGAVAFNDSGFSLNSLATAGSSVRTTWEVLESVYSRRSLYLGNPSFSVSLTISLIVSSIGSSFFGIGEPTVSGTGHTYTVNHIGFKILKSDGVASLYATQGDGITENSLLLISIIGNDDLDLVFKINKEKSVNYYYSKNGVDFSPAFTLIGNFPSSSSSISKYQFSTSNNSTAGEFGFILKNASYER